MKRIQRTFIVEGLNIERFLQKAGEQGLQLHDIKRVGRQITASTEESNLELLSALAQRCGWQLTIGNRTGAGCIIDKLQKRWMLAVCIIICVILVLLGTQVIWRIEIEDAGSYEADLRQALGEMSVTPPLLRSRIDSGAIRDALEWRYPQVAWFECGFRGMSFVVRAVEGILPEAGESLGACDVVATRDGIVDHIVTRAGTPLVTPGAVIRKGQVLIRGEERSGAGMVHPVAARGSVYARVWDMAQVRMSAREVQTCYTGRTETAWTVSTPWFDLWNIQNSCYDQEDVSVKEMPLGGVFLPFVYRQEMHMEAEINTVPADREQIIEMGKEAATRKLLECVGEKESLVDIWMNWSIIDDEILLFAATGERIIDIAQQERDSGMAATE